MEAGSTEGKEKENWGHVNSENFTELLEVCGTDALLNDNLKDEHPTLVNKVELRKDL